jgi:hypothetical protein
MAKEYQEAAAYIRICEGCPGRPEQESEIHRKAESLGRSISSHFVETASIAATDIIDRRVVLFELLAAARAGRIDTVIASSHTVIARTPVEAAIVAVLLERSNCRLLFAEPFDIEPYRRAATDFIEGRAAGGDEQISEVSACGNGLSG